MAGDSRLGSLENHNLYRTALRYNDYDVSCRWASGSRRRYGSSSASLGFNSVVVCYQILWRGGTPGNVLLADLMGGSPGRSRGTSVRGSQATPSPLSRPASTRVRGRGRARTHADRDSSSSSDTSTSSRNLSPEKRQREASPDAGVNVSRLGFGERLLSKQAFNANNWAGTQQRRSVCPSFASWLSASGPHDLPVSFGV